jgi:hypothetical protein
MKATFDFRQRNNTEDFALMCTAFGWSHELADNRVTIEYEANSFGQVAGEAAVFAPVQITVDN